MSASKYDVARYAIIEGFEGNEIADLARTTGDSMFQGHAKESDLLAIIDSMETNEIPF